MYGSGPRPPSRRRLAPKTSKNPVACRASPAVVSLAGWGKAVHISGRPISGWAIGQRRGKVRRLTLRPATLVFAASCVGRKLVLLQPSERSGGALQTLTDIDARLRPAARARYRSPRPQSGRRALGPRNDGPAPPPQSAGIGALNVLSRSVLSFTSST